MRGADLAQVGRCSGAVISAMHARQVWEKRLAGIRNWWAKVMFDWRTGFQGMSSRWQRAQAYVDLYWVDHGFLRALYGNEYEIAPMVTRRAQPSPKDVRAFAARGGKTILNLRGEGRGGPYLLEREACFATGVALVDVRISSRKLPARETLLEMADVLAKAERPLLFHCKSGADRAGLAAGMFVVLHGGSVADAQAQLAARYLHFRASPTGVLDQLFVEFGESGSGDFLQWVKTDYEPGDLEAKFHANRWGAVFVDWILRRE